MSDGTDLTSADVGTSDVDIDPWHNHPLPENLGGRQYGRLLEAFRLLQDRFSAACPPDGEVGAVADEIGALAERFLPWQAPERQTAAGTRLDLPGRGSPLLLPFVVDEWTDDRVRGRVTFRRFHLGGHGAAHGGTLPLLFDEVLGRLANSGDRPIARTAYLTVNYRRITRVGIEHHLEADVQRIEGRKRWVTGLLTDPDGTTVSDAEGLFVQLRPGQP
jgi:acyl-coenzyme A thioesterase PaaI-like protein